MGSQSKMATTLTNGTQPLMTFVYAGLFWLVGGDKVWGVVLVQALGIAIGLAGAWLLYRIGLHLLSGDRTRLRFPPSRQQPGTWPPLELGTLRTAWKRGGSRRTDRGWSPLPAKLARSQPAVADRTMSGDLGGFSDLRSGCGTTAYSCRLQCASPSCFRDYEAGCIIRPPNARSRDGRRSRPSSSRCHG